MTPRAGTAAGRTTDLLNAIDAQCREELELYGDWFTGPDNRGELLALRHLVECLTRIVQAHPTVAEFAEVHAARAAEALDLIEENT